MEIKRALVRARVAKSRAKLKASGLHRLNPRLAPWAAYTYKQCRVLGGTKADTLTLWLFDQSRGLPLTDAFETEWDNSSTLIRLTILIPGEQSPTDGIYWFLKHHESTFPAGELIELWMLQHVVWVNGAARFVGPEGLEFDVLGLKRAGECYYDKLDDHRSSTKHEYRSWQRTKARTQKDSTPVRPAKAIYRALIAHTDKVIRL